MPYCDSTVIDNLGNLIILKKGKKSNKKIMLEAHMDEIGLMVKKINKDGFLEVVPVGGIDVRILLGKTVTMALENSMFITVGNAVLFIVPFMILTVAAGLAMTGDKKK